MSRFSNIACVLCVLGAAELSRAEPDFVAPGTPALEPEVAQRPYRMCGNPDEFNPRALIDGVPWPGGVVPYRFAEGTSAANQAAMRLAMNELETVCNLTFTTNITNSNYLNIFGGTGNYATSIGMASGVVDISIFNWNQRITMEHELMHALGYRHEQARPDRNSYITVNYGNIQAGWGSQYDIQPGTPTGPYNFESIMHYGPCGASVCCAAGSDCGCSGASCWTMTALPQYAASQSLMGNRSYLSAGDKSALVARYGAPIDDAYEDNDSIATAKPLALGTHALRLIDSDDYFVLNLPGSNTLMITCTYPEADMNLGLRLYDSAGVLLQTADTTSGSETLFRPVSAGTFYLRAGKTLRWGANYTLNVAVECPFTQQLSPAVSPSPREKAAVAFDVARGNVVMFGGGNFASGPVRFAETYTWDGSTFTLRAGAGPSARTNTMMAYDDARAETILFGGYDGANELNDMWVWNGNAWSSRDVPRPSGRDNASITYDSDRQQVLMFGGFHPGGARSNETWIWNGTTWTYLCNCGPSPREGAGLAYDPVAHVAVLFGGFGSGNLGDTWLWNGSTWTLASTTGPSPRNYPRLAFDPRISRVVLYGGYDGSTNLSDLWTWDGVAWTRMSPTVSPGRAAHSLVYDPIRGSTLVFGGFGDAGWLGDTRTITMRLAPTIQTPPTPTSATEGSTAVMSVAAIGAAPLSYQWRRNAANLSNGSTPWGSVISGATSATLTITNVATNDEGAYSVVIAGTCSNETTTSAPATLDVVVPACPSDLDDGSGSGTPDGGVDINDLLYFLTAFELGDNASDLDDGSGAGVPDGGVDINDLLYFLSHFEAGC